MPERLRNKGINQKGHSPEQAHTSEVLIMRFFGIPTREDVQEFMHQTGAELVGAYRVWGGIVDPNSKNKEATYDGMEFMFRTSSRDLVSPRKGVTIHIGRDMTDFYREGFQPQSTRRQRKRINSPSTTVA